MTDYPVETGFAELSVYEPVELPSVPVRPNLNANQIAIIAKEMAMAILDPQLIWRAAGINQAQFERFVQPTETYKRVYETYAIEWESALSTNKRIAIKAAAALEDALPDLARRMVDAHEPLNQATEVAKTFAKLAGAGEQAREGGSPGEKFTITINLHDPREKAREQKTIQPQPEGPSVLPAIRLITERPDKS